MGPVGSQVFIGVVAAVATYFTVGAASSAFLSAFNVAVGPPTAALSAAANIVGGVAGGMVGGGLASGLQGGNLNSIARGAGAGGLLGGIQGYYGNTWNLERVAASSVGGGVSSAIKGGTFTSGAVTSLAVSTLSYAAVSMRQYEWGQSQLNPENAGGKSDGYMGIGGKLAGERVIAGKTLIEMGTGGLFGGVQGGDGYFWGMKYAPGSFLDHLNEAFAGPHDFFNHAYWYDKMGNQIAREGIEKYLGEGFSGANILLASPFVAASAIPTSVYHLLPSIR
jgi:hypothetical protein